MPVSDAAVRNAKLRAKPCKISDSGGLYVQDQPNRSRIGLSGRRINVIGVDLVRAYFALRA